MHFVSPAGTAYSFFPGVRLTDCEYGLPSSWHLGALYLGTVSPEDLLYAARLPFARVAARASSEVGLAVRLKFSGKDPQASLPSWVPQLGREMGWPRTVGRWLGVATEMTADVPPKHFHLFGRTAEEALGGLLKLQAEIRRLQCMLERVRAPAEGRATLIAALHGWVTEEELKLLLALGRPPTWLRARAMQVVDECQKKIGYE